MKRILIIFAAWLLLSAVASAQIIYAVGQRNATLTVSASDTPAALKNLANYKCDGTADEVEINAAIAALPTGGATSVKTSEENTYASAGGTILLLAGTYNLDAPISNTTVNACVLRGEGQATILNNRQTDAGHAIHFNGVGQTYGLNRCQIRDLLIQGNYTSAEVRSGDGLVMADCNYNQVNNVHAISNGGNGISFISTATAKGAENKIISDCQMCFNHGYGFYCSETHDLLMSGCEIEENYNDQVRVVKNYGFYVSNCSIEDGHGTYAIHIESGQLPYISGTTVETNACKFAPSIAGTNAMFTGSCFAGVEIAGTVAYKLGIAGCRLYTFTVTGTAGEIAMSSSNMTMDDVTANVMLVTGCDVTMAAGAVVMINDALCFNACEWDKTDDTASIVAGANTARISISDCDIRGNTFLIDGDAKTGVRLSVTGNNLRVANFTFEDLSEVLVASNMLHGTSALTVDNTDGSLLFSGNSFQAPATLYTITINATCAATPRFLANDMTGLSLTDNTGKAVVPIDTTFTDGAGNTITIKDGMVTAKTAP